MKIVEGNILWDWRPIFNEIISLNKEGAFHQAFANCGFDFRSIYNSGNSHQNVILKVCPCSFVEVFFLRGKVYIKDVILGKSFDLSVVQTGLAWRRMESEMLSRSKNQFLLWRVGNNCLHLGEGFGKAIRGLKLTEFCSVQGSECPYLHISHYLIISTTSKFCPCKQATHEAQSQGSLVNMESEKRS